jgi:hypothetical protein
MYFTLFGAQSQPKSPKNLKKTLENAPRNLRKTTHNPQFQLKNTPAYYYWDRPIVAILWHNKTAEKTRK